MTKIDLALRNLRHLYEQMLIPGRITDQTSAAKGLLGPAIELIETEETNRKWKEAHDNA